MRIIGWQNGAIDFCPFINHLFAAVPAGYDAVKTADTLKRLTKQCKSIKKAVKAKKTDAELTAMITEAHEIFHEIMEKCRT